MGYYFDDSDSVSASGLEPADIIRLLGNRFMECNPPVPYVWRTFDERGIQTDQKARSIMDFSALFPGGTDGEIVFAAAELLCPRAKGSRFVVECYGPVEIWLNGACVFQSNGNQERSHEPCSFPVQLNRGPNRFVWRCERTALGFGCSFSNAMPQWEPCCYVLPWDCFGGEAGILYSLPVDEHTVTDLSVFFRHEPPASLRWIPDMHKRPYTGNGIYAVRFSAVCRQFPAFPSGVSFCSENGTRFPRAGEAGIFTFTGPLSEILPLLTPDSWADMKPPIPVQGNCTPYLILGPLKNDPTGATSYPGPGEVVEGAHGPVVWRTGYENVAIRPYVESDLFGRWTYPLGVTLYGMLEAARDLGIPAMLSYVVRHVSQVISIHDYALWDRQHYGFPGVNQQICWLDALDDCGSFGSLMLECMPKDHRAIKLSGRIAKYMLHEQPRTGDGAFCRRDDTMWADDMYMSVPFLCRYSALSGDPSGFETCAAQLLAYRDLLLIPQKRIMSHMRCLRAGKANGIPWSRGNGWVLFSLSELLMKLPMKHEKRKELLDFFLTLTEGYLPLQDADGLWHQVLDEPDTYPESSATAMFLCAFSRGLRFGWYPQSMCARVRASAEKAWNGLCLRTVDRQGNLYGVCRGSGFSFSRAYYRSLSWNFNDTHGIGIVMLAGVEYLRLCSGHGQL